VAEQKAVNVFWHEGDISRDERWKALKVKGCTLWFTGLSGSGKSTIASALEQALVNRGIFSYRLDGDNVRFGLNAGPKILQETHGYDEKRAARFGLGFSAEDRAENIRRIGEVTKLFADSGCISMTSFISPYRKDRDLCRKLHETAKPAPIPFIEVFVDTPLEVCEKRDPKKLYVKARADIAAGKNPGFTGLDDPYEAPASPELVLKTADLSVQQSVEKCLALLKSKGFIS
jgi:adenylylsulfate kinase